MYCCLCRCDGAERRRWRGDFTGYKDTYYKECYDEETDRRWVDESVTVREERGVMVDVMAIPVARFTYYERGLVRLFSSVGFGVGFGADTNGGMANVNYGYDVTLIGVTVGHKHWFGDFEFGGLGYWNMGFLPTRMLNVSVGYRF